MGSQQSQLSSKGEPQLVRAQNAEARVASGRLADALTPSSGIRPGRRGAHAIARFDPSAAYRVTPRASDVPHGAAGYLITRSQAVSQAPCSLSRTSTMRSRVANTVVRTPVLRSTARRAAVVAARRHYVQPSGADRASVVDVPSAYQEDAYFTPRSGMYGCNEPYTQYD